MNRTLINKVKYNKHIYSVYFTMGNLFVSLLKHFVKADEKLIVFSSFGGRKYDDSPRCIYEAMLKDHRFSDYKLVWAFIRPDKFEITRGSKIKTDTLEYYKALLSARVWITNSTMERGLSFYGKNTFYFNTWHGTPIKVLGIDVKNTSSFVPKGKSHIDAFLAQGGFDANTFSRVFNLRKEIIHIIGLPRNDELAAPRKEDVVKKVKQQLGIPENKKVLLYAPTFREYSKDANSNCVLTPPINLTKWQHELKDYVLLFRAHYEVVKVMNVEDNDFVKNASSYPNLNELMIVSDILISDYSSIFFDWSVTGKPMLCFSYDYDEYQEKRGMYFDIREALDSYIDNEDALIAQIKETPTDSVSLKCIQFRDKYVTAFGDASVKSLDIIYQNLHK